jgi:beta-glucosidase
LNKKHFYPKGFLWGTATSSHQVEGGSTGNNWIAFEEAKDANGCPRIAGGQRSGRACEHWERYREDIRLMTDVGLNAYRFSVEWSKIEPGEGLFDQEVLRHYETLVEALLAAGVTPMLTLHHFTNPLWFEARGGFLSEDSPAVFSRFARVVYQRLSDRIPLWCTINEPAVFAVNGYFTGEFPPAHHSARSAATVLRNLLRTHSAVYDACKSINPGPAIGLATNMFVYEPASAWNPFDVAIARIADRNLNDAILEYLETGRFRFGFPGVVRARIDANGAHGCDFVGLNYYTRFFLHWSPLRPRVVLPVTSRSTGSITDMGWEIHPEGLGLMLDRIGRMTSKPIYVTENGLADDSDTLREAFMNDHLAVVEKKVAGGLDLRGFFFWTLMDNFEWAHGFTKRFGLYRVDFETQKRTLRKGSGAYLEYIRSVGYLA